MQLWEIEKSPDGTFDILLNGRPETYGLTDEQVKVFFEMRDVDLGEVEGGELLG